MRGFEALAFDRSTLAAAEIAVPSPATGPGQADLYPTHVPALAPRDEATFLLHIAAEIEHALMVQYLYAAYSLDPQATGLTPTQSVQVAKWKRDILAIAKEEMAHFISVQNILISLGAPLNFARDTYPIHTQFYPFDLNLEPLTIRRSKLLAADLAAPNMSRERLQAVLFSASLNRYVAAEMPDIGQVPPGDRELVKALTQGEQVNRVGSLYERLLKLFDAGPIGGLLDSDFDGERLDLQGGENEWGGTDTGGVPFHPLVRPVKTRAEAQALLAEIAEQGEGHQERALTSHFQRFLAIYKELELFDPKQSYLHPVATNPSTAPGDAAITDPRACAWAQLANLRYRQLLGYLWHFLSTGGDLFTTNGDRTPHGWLIIATYYEMSHIKGISELLIQLPLDGGGTTKAGPPFELPYVLALPEREKDRWRVHLDVLTAARRLAANIEADFDPAAPAAAAERALLSTLAEGDVAALTDLEALRQGQAPPVGNPTTKVRRILDEAVRGFPPPKAEYGHGAFWRESAFPDVDVFDTTPAVKRGDGTNSNLVRALRGELAGMRRMPAGRAPVDPNRIDFIKHWIDGLPAEPPGTPEPPGHTGQPSNGSATMGRYQEIIDILDNAVGGSAAPVAAHGAFWRGKTRDQFVATNVFGQKLLLPGDGAGSTIIKALSAQAPFGVDVGTPGASFRRMPAGRAPVPDAKIAIIKKWIDDNCPE
jgi:hypothetical protein